MNKIFTIHLFTEVICNQWFLLILGHQNNQYTCLGFIVKLLLNKYKRNKS